MKIVVLASGRGSNFEAIAQGIDSGEIPHSKIIAVVSNKQDAPVLEKAKVRKIPTHIVRSKNFVKDGKFDRASYEKILSALLKKLEPDIICLAGYMLLMGATLIGEWEGKILNIHPSLLPKYKGLEAQKQALDAGEKEAGCTVHFVTEEMDAGPIVLQAKVPILPGDTAETLSARLLPVEHETYRKALALLVREPVVKNRG